MYDQKTAVSLGLVFEEVPEEGLACVQYRRLHKPLPVAEGSEKGAVCVGVGGLV